MDDPVAHALGFVRNLAALAERLATRNIVVRTLRCDWSAFGSWTLDASRCDAEAKRSAAIRLHALTKQGLRSAAQSGTAKSVNYLWDRRQVRSVSCWISGGTLSRNPAIRTNMR
jgi:hypothetical protein